MKKLLMIMLVFLPLCAVAQPKAKRTQQKAQQPQQQQQQQSGANALTTRARLTYPKALNMDADVVWRRDVYRVLDLNEDANGGLYYPVTPQGSQMNLFTYMFKLMLSGQIKAYEYKLDGNENFTDSARIKPLRFLDDYHIFYEKGENGKIRLDNSDIPSAEVKKYYIKESAFYDQKSATFHRKVLALCPIMEREEDWGSSSSMSFGDDGDFKAPTTNYPLFWVKYDDLAPFLSKQTIMTSNLNNAATMSMDDFFNKNLYKGKIYKTVNLMGKTLQEYCPTDSAMKAEQDRIEREIIAFETGVWGDKVSKAAEKDSLDSIAAVDKKAAKKTVKQNRRTSTSTSSSTKKENTVKTKAPKASGNKVSVRRQRH